MTVLPHPQVSPALENSSDKSAQQAGGQCSAVSAARSFSKNNPHIKAYI